MKIEFLIVSLLMVPGALAEESCGSAKPGRDCEIVKVLTRCDVDKQALKNKISKLEKRVAELENKEPTYIVKESVTNEVVEKEVIKHNILALYMARDLYSTSNSQQPGTATETMTRAYVPGLKYQYEFSCGLVPELGINIKGSPIFGLGFEF